MITKNNIIFIYGKTASFKSTIGVSLINNCDNSCYINLEGNKHIKVNENVKVITCDDININALNFIKNSIKVYDTIGYLALDYNMFTGNGIKDDNEKALFVNTVIRY